MNPSSPSRRCLTFVPSGILTQPFFFSGSSCFLFVVKWHPLVLIKPSYQLTMASALDD